MGERDLFAGAGDQNSATTTSGAGSRTTGRDVFTGAGDRDAGQGTTTGHLPGDLHSVWAQSNCNWRPDKDTTHPAVQAWRAASREHWHDPIKADADGYYTVKYPDCLDSIASRVLETTTGKPPTSEQINAEKEAIAQANHEHYPGILDCSPHFVGDGWKLILPGLQATDSSSTELPEKPGSQTPLAEQSQPDQSRLTERRGGLSIENESGGTVIIHEGHGDCNCGPPPVPLDGAREQYSELAPPLPVEPLVQQFGRFLTLPGDDQPPPYYAAPPQIFVLPRPHFPPPWDYGQDEYRNRRWKGELLGGERHWGGGRRLQGDDQTRQAYWQRIQQLRMQRRRDQYLSENDNDSF